MDKEKLLNLPEEPGVYLMKDKTGTIIYIGKAKVLKNRIKQYFQSNTNHSPKVRAMVGHIHTFEYIITDSELEALILECNLIKTHKPYYNILLKDDKHYPYIKVTIREEYPRIFLTRKMVKDGNRYFGPYTSSQSVREAIDMASKLCQIPTCGILLPKDMGRKKVCLNAHIEQCIAPCVNPISKQEYKKRIADACRFFEGDHKDLLAALQEEMEQAAENLEYERAGILRDKILALKKIEERQKIISEKQVDEDIVGFYKEGQKTYCAVLFVRRGRMIGRYNTVMDKTGDLEEGVLCNEFLKQFYSDRDDIPKKIYVSTFPEEQELLCRWLSRITGRKTDIICPKRGEKKMLTDLSCKNARQNAVDHLLRDRGKNIPKGLVELKDKLGLSVLPSRIESYDISHTAGQDAVGSMVVFCDGKSAKKEYRHFKIQVAKGGDDCESMTEVLYRRLRNAREEMEKQQKGEAFTPKFLPLPDVIVLDGGKAQVQAIESLFSVTDTDIPLFGMVKDNHHKTRGVMNSRGEEILLSKSTAAFRLLSEIQEEVHRFAIDYHKKLRSKQVKTSVLEEIEGVGKETVKRLIKHFKTLSAIKNATEEELYACGGIPKKTLKNIYNFFHKTS